MRNVDRMWKKGGGGKVGSKTTYTVFKFGGNAEDFPELCSKFEDTIRTKLGDREYRFIFQDGWRNDVLMQVYDNIPPSLHGIDFIEEQHPEGGIIQRRVTDQERVTRQSYIASLVEHNQKINEMEANILVELKSLLTDAVISDINMNVEGRQRGDPISVYSYLKSTYGPDNHEESMFVDPFHSLLKFWMDSSYEFIEWHKIFEEKCKFLGLNENKKIMLSLLRSCNDRKHLIQMLPKRLNEALKYTYDNRLNYDGTVEYLKRKDNEYWAINGRSGIQPVNSRSISNEASKQISRVKQEDWSDNVRRDDKECENCYQKGHKAKDCNLMCCLECMRFGHKTVACLNPGRNLYAKNYGMPGVKRNQGNDYNGKSKPYTRRGNSPYDNESQDMEDHGKGKDQKVIKSQNNKIKMKKEHENTLKKKSNHGKKNVKRVSIHSNDGSSDESSDYNSSEGESEDVSESNERIGYRNRQGDSEDDDGSGDDSQYIAQSAINARYLRKTVHRVQSINMVKENTSGNDSVIFKAKLDSGADVHCIKPLLVKTEEELVEVIQEYDNYNRASVTLCGATGEKMDVVAQGFIENIEEPAYVVAQLDANLLSGPLLQKQGLWTIGRPAPHSDYIIADKTGKVWAIADQNLEIDLRKIGTYDFTIGLPNIPENIGDSEDHGYVRNVLKTKKSNEDISNYLHGIGHFNKEEMLFMTDHNTISGLGITSQDIKKTLKQCVACLKGKMYRTDMMKVKAPIKKDKSLSNDAIYNDLRAKDAKKFEVRNLRIGWEVSSDIIGPIHKTYGMAFRDKASGLGSFYTLTSDGKKSVEQKVKEEVSIYKKYGHHKDLPMEPIVTFRSDNENVYKTSSIKSFLNEQCIESKRSSSYDHWENGHIEVHVKQVNNIVTCFFVSAKWMPEVLWPAAWHFATFTENLRKCMIPGSTVSRLESFTNIHPNLNTMAIMQWGQPCEVFNPKENRNGKFGEKSLTCAYIGLSLDTPESGLFYHFGSKRIISRRTYTILEHVPSTWLILNPTFFNWDKIGDDGIKNQDTFIAKSEPIIQSKLIEQKDETQTQTNLNNSGKLINGIDGDKLLTANSDDNRLTTSTAPAATIESSNEVTVSEVMDETAQHQPSEQSVTVTPTNLESSLSEGETIGIRTSIDKKIQFVKIQRIDSDDVMGVRTIKLKTKDGKLSDQEFNLHIYRTKNGKLKIKSKRNKKDPDAPTLQEAMGREDWLEFKKAINAEYDQLEEEKVYQILNKNQIPFGVQILGTMMVLQIKRHPNGKIDKYKARLVVLGNQQRKDTYDKIKSPTARSSTVKLLISIQAKLNLYSLVIDVKGAYLKSKIKKSKLKSHNLFIRLPNGKFAKLRKYLYGLKQAGIMWNNLLSITVQKYGYKRSNSDPCVFYFTDDKIFTVFVVHVDDLYAISNYESELELLIEILTDEFKEITKKSGDLLAYLGCNIIRNKDGSITISQSGYVDKIIHQVLGQGEHKKIYTPTSENIKESEEDNDSVDAIVYLTYIGLLNYLAVFTRLEILYALSICAQHCVSPTKRDLKKVIRIFLYINTTKEYGITFSGNTNDFKLYAWADASHNCYSDGKGHGCVMFSLGIGDGVFYARSFKIKIVTLSAYESEYVVLCECATEVIFIRRLLKNIGLKQVGPTTIFEDNAGVIASLADTNDTSSIRTKHINVKYHFTKEKVKCKVLDVVWIETENQLADLGTKGLSKRVHMKHTHTALNIN